VSDLAPALYTNGRYLSRKDGQPNYVASILAFAPAGHERGVERLLPRPLNSLSKPASVYRGYTAGDAT
jgi:hypothetical protein